MTNGKCGDFITIVDTVVICINLKNYIILLLHGLSARYILV